MEDYSTNSITRIIENFTSKLEDCYISTMEKLTDKASSLIEPDLKELKNNRYSQLLKIIENFKEEMTFTRCPNYYLGCEARVRFEELESHAMECSTKFCKNCSNSHVYNTNY